VHLAVGGVIGALLLIAVPMALIFVAQRFGIATDQLADLTFGPLDENDTWWWTGIGVVLLVVTVYVIAALGALAAVMAPVLLGPSQAERLAALEARSRRLAERNRLARDLHDSIGHALTVTTLQAGAARAVFDSDPAFARRALAAIEETGRLAMDDLDHVLGMLRDDRAGAQPLRTLDDLERLCADSAAGGADVDCELIGPVGTVPAVMSREGYRIVQEGLTNAARHAGRVPVRLVVTVSGEALAITISNPVTTAAVDGRAGSGLRGMRERVDLLGGQITAGAVDGEWRVAVRLPFGGRP
jgi:signal transduction histidine kinase